MMSKKIKKILKKQKDFLKKSIKVKSEERIGKFNLFLIGSIALIAVFSIGQIASQKIILTGRRNNLPKFQITTDIFVDGNSVIKKGNGTPSKPFKMVQQALDLIVKNPQIKNIYLYPAQYKGFFEIPQNVNLYAYHPDTLLLNLPPNKKTLLLKGNNLIRGLTIQGGRYAVFIPKEAQSIQIQNCKIEKADWYGIYNEKHPEANDRYSLKITDSEISQNSLQGLYLQKGTFSMDNSKSINNGEEGVDLHIDMNSTITNSEISNNGEGGIETELGNINLTVQNCLIKNNESSGINLQTYSENSSVKIEGNQINNNRDFGIRCALHAKISRPYFTKAFETYPLKINEFSNNGKTSIDPNCRK